MRKFLKSFYVLMLSVLIIIAGSVASFANTAVGANDWSQRDVVTSIVFENPKLIFMQKTKITVNFEFKDTDTINSGDTLTLLAPEKIDLFKIPEGDKIELIHTIDDVDIVFGTAVTNEDRSAVVVTFNDNVTKHKIKSGLVYFTGSAQWIGPENPTEKFDITESFDTKLGTDIKSPTNYTIQNWWNEGTHAYFSKPKGFIQHEHRNHVYWTMSLNPGHEIQHSDVKIVDTLHDGQKFSLIDESKPVSVSNLAPEYFYLYLTTPGSDTLELSIENFVKEGYGTIDFDIDNPNKMYITVFKDVLNPRQSILFTYYSKITDPGKLLPQFYNEAKADYFDENQNPVSYEMVSSADNIFEGGSVVPVDGALRIVKLLDLDTESIPLPGVTFEIFHEDGTPVAGYEDVTLITNELGYVDTKQLVPGKYFIKEVDAPGYVNFDSNKEYPFLISSGNSSAIGLTVHNKLKTDLVHVQKVWNDTFLTHPEVTINLLANGAEVEELKLNAANDWKGLFDNLLYNDALGNKIVYTVSEDPIDGYKTDITYSHPGGYMIANTLISDISASKTSDKKVIQPNETFNYTITVSNDTDGSLPVDGILVEDMIPSGLTATSTNAYVNGVLVNDVIKDNKLNVEVNHLMYGYPIDIVFEVRADSNALGMIKNTANVTNPFEPDKPLTPNTDVEVKKPNALIGIDKTVSKEIVEIGEEFEYKIVVNNTTDGSDPISSVVVKDELPKHIVFTDYKIYVDGVYVLDAVGDSFEIRLSDLNYGDSKTITFKVKAVAGALGAIVNTAIAWDEKAPNKPVTDDVEVGIKPLTEVEIPLTPIDPNKPSTPIKPLIPTKPKTPTEKPELPATGVSSMLNQGIVIILLGSFAILKRSKK